MNICNLLISASAAISGLITNNVRAVAVGWDDSILCLTLRYYLSRDPTDEEREMCSCALAELEAEYHPYIQSAKDQCVFSVEPIEKLDPLSGWSYIKK